MRSCLHANSADLECREGVDGDPTWHFLSAAAYAQQLAAQQHAQSVFKLIRSRCARYCKRSFDVTAGTAFSHLCCLSSLPTSPPPSLPSTSPPPSKNTTGGIVDGAVSGAFLGLVWRGAVVLADKLGVKEHIEKARDNLHKK